MSDGGSAGGGASGPEPRPSRTPRLPAWLQQLLARQVSSTTVLGVAAAAFAAGILTAAVISIGPHAKTAQAEAVGGGPWGLFGKPRAADAARPAQPKPEGFAVWKTRIDTSGPEPRACIEFSRALDPARNYGDFVNVAPDVGGKPAVTAKGSELCLAGLGFLERKVTLLKGLPALSGETLADNAEATFAFGDKPPYVGFAGGGVILPREEADGVGIETVNVSRVAVEVWRVADRNLVRKQISAPDPTGEGDYASDYGADSAGNEGRLIWQGQMSVKGDPGQRTTTVFPLGAVLKDMKPGGYLIKVKDASGVRGLKSGKKKKSHAVNEDGEEDDGGYDPNPPAQARRWVMFTDMALTAYQGSDGLDVVVRSLNSAKVLPDLRVALVSVGGEDLAVGRTDAQGRLRFDKPLLEGDAGDKARMVMAYGPQGDLAVLDLDRAPVDLSSQGVGGRVAGKPDARTVQGAVDAYLYADRGIYRPGETAHVNALLRDHDTRAVKDRKGFIVVHRPSGTEFARYRFDKTPLGSIAADVVLPKTAPRGQWKVALELDGVDDPAGTLALDVEDFAPQRLAVTMQGREAVPLTGTETRVIDVNSRFLYGAPGAGLQTEAEARLKADPDPFPQFKGYEWGDQKTPFEEKFLDLDRTVTDGEGKAAIHLSSFAGQGVTQPLEAAMTASVFEPGGRPVREQLKFKVRTLPLYLGVKTEVGDARWPESPPVTVSVIAADAFGRRVAAQNVGYTLISEAWTFDWFKQGDRWQWRRSSRDVVVQKGVLNVTAAAPARFARRLGWGDYRLELEGPQGAKSVIRFAAGWGEPAKDVEAPDVARVSAGAKPYRQGDTVEIKLKAPYAGEAQVAIATDRLIDFKTVSLGKDGGSVRFKSNPAWGGGAYVLVSVIQPRDPATNPKPRRALGVMYVPLNAAGRTLAVTVGTPAKAPSKKGLDVPLTIKGESFHGKARVTLAAVDEGILQITHFESPDPAKWYFGKRALSLNYRDDYGRLLDPNLGAPANVNFGGDETGGAGLTTTPIRTIALWSGVVETDAAGHAVVHLPAPDFNGELRIMAVAWTDEAVGSGSKPVTVREPVVADLNLPRFLAPGDRATATLELHNLEGRPGGYTASLTSQGGPATGYRKLFPLPLGQRIAERIPINAPRAAGVGKVGFRVQGPGFTTGRDYPIETRLGWGQITRGTIALQKPGESYTPKAELMAGLTAGDTRLEVSYSPFRGFDPAPISAALQRYPYGCTEQLVSGAYPLMYALELNPKLGNAGLNQAIGRLLDRQSLDGAFGLWRVGDAEADPWLGAYATDFLIEAKRLGAPVPQEAIDRALSAMRMVSQPEGFSNVGYRMQYPDWWGPSSERSKAITKEMRSRASAYALYVMAKGGQGDLPRLRWWHDVQMTSDPSPLARAQVATGLALMGDQARARSGFERAVQALGYKEEYDWYQSPLRDLAGVIALAYEAGQPDVARKLQMRLENAVKNPDALNTQEEARLLQAAHAMLKAAGPVRVTAQGAIALNTTAGAPRWGVTKLAAAHFTNQGTGGLWRTVTVTGAPVSPPSAMAAGLTLSKQLFTFRGEDVNPGALKQGERVIVLVRGRSAQARTTQVVVDDPLPAGWEIETVLGTDDAKDGPFKFLGTLTDSRVREARDDRFVGATEVEGGKEFAFAYVARAVTPGDYLLPGAQARDMYRPTIAARTAARRTAIAPGSVRAIRRLTLALMGLMGLEAAVCALDLAFPPDLTRAERASPVVLDRHGAWLRALPVETGRWRLRADLERTDPRFLRRVVAVEDARFWVHPGVDPAAIVRAVAGAAAHGHATSGASTLTMQTVRLLEPRPRTLASKLIETARAFQLEARFSKRQILGLYLTLAPYGGNLEGVRAASLSYFGHEPETLTDGEQALLIALPQSPEARRPDRKPAAARDARRAVLAKFARMGLVSKAAAAEADAEPLGRRAAFPALAWHASGELARAAPFETATVVSTLDARLQARLEPLAKAAAAAQGEGTTAAILVVDVDGRAVRALVGSAGLASPGGWIDMTRARRSPGSTLKPFIYAFAFQDGLAAPDTVIDDNPRRFADYRPENFDRTFHDKVSAREALANSLNVPAVATLAKVGPGAFEARLAGAGVTLDRPQARTRSPGLAIALGGVGVSLRDLAVLYAALGDDGLARPLAFTEDEAARNRHARGRRLVSAEAAGQVLDILRETPPPEGASPAALTRDRPAMAFKTGTSYGFRDALACGVVGRYVVVVWTGRPDGGARGGLTGRDSALPVLFQVADLLDAPAAAPHPIAPQAAPPALGRLERADAGPRLIFPPDHATVEAPGFGPASRGLALAAAGSADRLSWYVNGEALSADPVSDKVIWRPRGAGFYTVTVVDAEGRKAVARVQVRGG